MMAAMLLYRWIILTFSINMSNYVVHIYSMKGVSPVIVNHGVISVASVCTDVRSNDNLFDMESNLLMDLNNKKPFQHRKCKSINASFLSVLLIGVESNPGPQLTFAMLNARSLRHKGAIIQDLITDQCLDLLVVSETWIYDDDPDAIKSCCLPPEYSILHECRTIGPGGGQAVIYKDTLKLKKISIKNLTKPSSFELQLFVVGDGGDIKLAVTNIYQPPQESKIGFVEELSDFLSFGTSSQKQKLLLCGDFNMPGSPETVDDDVITMLDEHGFIQLVKNPTREENILDLIAISEECTGIISQVTVRDVGPPFDHRLVGCTLNVDLTRQPHVKYTFRDLKRIDLCKLKHMFSESTLFSDPADSRLMSLPTNLLPLHATSSIRWLRFKPEQGSSGRSHLFGFQTRQWQPRENVVVLSIGGNREKVVRRNDLNTESSVNLQTS